MSTVIPIKPNSTADVRQVVATITDITQTEDIDEIIVILHRSDKTDIYVKGAVSNRWSFIGYLEEIKHWLLESDNETS